MEIRKKPVKIAKTALCLSSLLVASSVAQAVEIGNSEWSGYVRQYTGINLKDVPETAEDDKYDIIKQRTSVLIQGHGSVGALDWTVVGRSTWEHRTDYLERLEDLSQMNASFVGG